MAYAAADRKVLGYLGRALSLELSSVQQHFAMSRLLKLRGFEDIAEKFHGYAVHKVEHVDWLISRMLVLGAAPSASQLRPARLGNSLPALVASAAALEAEIALFYQLAQSYCAGTNDYDNRVFFDRLFKDATNHAKQLSDWHNQEFGFSA